MFRCVATVLFLLQTWCPSARARLQLPTPRHFADHAAVFRQFSAAALNGSASDVFKTSCSRNDFPVIRSWSQTLRLLPSERPPATRLFPGFVLGPISESISELHLVGDWKVHTELCVTPGRLREQVMKEPTNRDSTNKISERRRHGIFVILRELCKSAVLVLHNDRQGTLLTSRNLPEVTIPKAIWQLKRRPFSDLVVEIEFAFPPEDPEYILVLSAPVRPGQYFPNSVRVGEGSAWIASSPFLPWQKTRVGTFVMHPKVMKSIVDPVLL